MKKTSSSASASMSVASRSVMGGSVLGGKSYFGGGSIAGGIGILGRQSEASIDSFPEEQHTMTRAELEYQPSDLEHEFMEEVTREVRTRVVLGQGSTSFGLRWECGTVDEPDYLLGGWLSKCSWSMLSSGVQNGPARFCVLNDESRTFQECLDERLKVRHSIPYDEMHTVRPRCQESKKSSNPADHVWYLQVFGKSIKWELMPIQRQDREIMIRWTAALQFRAGCYDPSISGDVTRANKAAVWTQSKFRMYKAKQRAQRRRERRNALMNRLKSAIGAVGGWDLGGGDSDDEDDDNGFLAVYSNQAYEVLGNLGSSAWNAVGSWLGLGGALTATAIEEEEQQLARGGADAASNATATKDVKRQSTFVQFSNDLPALGEGEVEDEVWENQRWNPAMGWSSKTLGATERSAFTDRLGRGSFGNPREGKSGGPPLPANWLALGDWQIDASGVTKGRCDKEGFVYSIDWPLLDSDLAKGKFVVHHSNRDFVRRRRWFRRRILDTTTPAGGALHDTVSPILAQGWLGVKSPGSGRWNSRMFVLTRPGLQIGSVVTKNPTLTQFRFAFKEWAEVVVNGGVDGAKWKALTERQCNTVELDPRTCVVDVSVADAKYSGYFALSIDGKGRGRTFNANDSNGRSAWYGALRTALDDAAKAKRPRTMRLVGGAFETTSYPTVVMDSLIMVPVDAAEEAFFQSPSVLAAVNVRQGFTNASATEWKANTRVVTYVDAKRGGAVTEKWVRARTEPGVGFVVDRRVEAPGAQFGDEFAVKCRFVLISAEMEGQKACRVLVSVDVEFVKQTMMVGFISSGARRELTQSLREVWLPAVVGYLQGKGFISEAKSDGNVIKWGNSQVSSSRGKKAGATTEKQESGLIHVERMG